LKRSSLLIDKYSQTVFKLAIENRQLAMRLLRFFVIRMLAAAPAKLAELEPICSRLLVLGCDVVAAFAIRALKYDVIARHN
jgi:hypothetical protein